MVKIDELDLKIMSYLVKDAAISIPKLSEKININTSVLYGRIKRLHAKNVIERVTIEVNEKILGYEVAAIIGVNIDSLKRKSIIASLKSLKDITRVSEVTGRFDIMVFIKSQSLDKLHTVVTQKIGNTIGVYHTETFVEMKKNIVEPKYTYPLD